MHPDALLLSNVTASTLAMEFGQLSEHFQKLVAAKMAEHETYEWDTMVQAKMNEPAAPIEIPTLDETCMQCGFTSRFWKVPPKNEPFRCWKCGAEL